MYSEFSRVSGGMHRGTGTVHIVFWSVRGVPNKSVCVCVCVSVGVCVFLGHDIAFELQTSLSWHCCWLANPQGAHGVVVSHPLRMRKALGSNPSVSNFANTILLSPPKLKPTSAGTLV